MPDATRPLAIITGASSGIGYELAKNCAENGLDLMIAADEPEIHNAADMLRRTGAEVERSKPISRRRKALTSSTPPGAGGTARRRELPGRTWPGDRLPNRPGLLAYSERMT
jgi:NAD(P)-dependent dehydrogenase (short-subunit alcohol dehydrogenase family)